jgi:hypothetical protein
MIPEYQTPDELELHPNTMWELKMGLVDEPYPPITREEIDNTLRLVGID